MEILQLSNFFQNNKTRHNLLQESNNLNIEFLGYNWEHECKGSPVHFTSINSYSFDELRKLISTLSKNMAGARPHSRQGRSVKKS